MSPPKGIGGRRKASLKYAPENNTLCQGIGVLVYVLGARQNEAS